jgi:hypothetical protein
VLPNNSERKAEVKVTVGALSLITPDPEEQIIEVFSNVTYPGYNRDTKLHDIALIEVQMSTIRIFYFIDRRD